MVLHNPNNWHWVNKDVAPWAREFLEKELVGLKAGSSDKVEAEISKVLSMDGDVDVSQRKGKVITIFDVKLQLEFSGTNADDESASGTITVPEVAHDTEQDEYVFEIETYADSLSKAPVKDLVRKELVPELRKKLSTLGPALIAAHSKDIQHEAGYKPTFAATKVYSSSSVSNSASASGANTPTNGATSTTSRGAKVNTTSLDDTEEFRTSAEELFITFTDPQRITAFTRAPPRTFEGAKPGGKFSLFDGNVEGSYSELDSPTKIVQNWRLKQWPEGHFSKLEIRFDQNDVDGVTVMRVTWNGVPTGQEEVTKRNWRMYYVESIKRTFGFGTVL